MFFLESNVNRLGLFETSPLVHLELLPLSVKRLFVLEELHLGEGQPTMAASSLTEPSTYRMCGLVIMIAPVLEKAQMSGSLRSETSISVVQDSFLLLERLQASRGPSRLLIQIIIKVVRF